MGYSNNPMESITGTIFEMFQEASLILALLTIFLCVKRGMLNKLIIFDIPMILLMVHGIVYYLAVFATRYGYLEHAEGTPFTYWSTALRFHGFATLFIISLTSYIREVRKIRDRTN